MSLITSKMLKKIRRLRRELGFYMRLMKHIPLNRRARPPEAGDRFVLPSAVADGALRFRPSEPQNSGTDKPETVAVVPDARVAVVPVDRTDDPFRIIVPVPAA